jgi:DNA-binding PadR family transcriptional regulator
VPPTLSTTSYALIGLLVFDSASSTNGMTGYELKHRADLTLRFYWVAPAMSQIYTELDRLRRHGLVRPRASKAGGRRSTRYVVTASGRKALDDWLGTSQPGFPVLKHPVALRLVMGSLMGEEAVTAMLDEYQKALTERRGDLASVRLQIGDNPELAFPAMVADWGLAYYDAEAEIVESLHRRTAAWAADLVGDDDEASG